MSIDPDWRLAQQFGLAILIGALVGIDREKRKAEGETSTGGIRTFMLLSLAGAAAALVARILDAPVVYVGALVVSAAGIVAGYAADRAKLPAASGLTTEIAAVVVFLLGGLCVLDHPELAVSLGIATSAVLAFKKPIHELVRKVGTEDLYAGLKLLIATFIVLPLLPHEAVDPWGAWVPYKLWLLVILISAMSLVGYVATRWLGPARGVIVTGITGGLVSSTAVTLALARRSHDAATPPAQLGTLAAGILIAWLVMVVRIEVLLLVANRDLAGAALLPVGLIGATTALAAALVLLANRRGAGGAPTADLDLSLKSPFSLSSAMKFGALFAVVLLLVKLAEQYPFAGGIHAVAALAGVTDVDAISLSMADYARAPGNANPALQAIIIAAASNTVAKGTMAAVLGRGPMRRQILLGTAAILAACAGAWFLV